MKVIITHLVIVVTILVSCASTFAIPAGPVTVQSSINTAGAGKCLDVAGGYTSQGTPIVQYDCHSGSNQRFIFIHVSPTVFMIQSSLNTSMCVGIADNSHGNLYELLKLEPCRLNGDIVPDGVKWRVDTINGLTRFKAFHSAPDGQNTCIDVASGLPNNSLWMQLYYCHEGGNQLWDIF